MEGVITGLFSERNAGMDGVCAFSGDRCFHSDYCIPYVFIDGKGKGGSLNLDKAVMRVLSRILESESGAKQKAVLQVMPVLRISTAFLCILLCALSHNAIYTVMVLAFELLRVAFMNTESMKHVMKNVLIAAMFAMVITLPAVFTGNPGTMTTVVMKVCESVMVLSVLNEIMTWKEVTYAFRQLHLPSLFVFVLESTMRYLVLLGRYADQMLEAVSLRSVGRTSWKDSHIGGILGTTFLKAQKMAQENNEAMQCRCFEGIYETQETYHFGLQDCAYLIVPVLLVVLFVYTESLL